MTQIPDSLPDRVTAEMAAAAIGKDVSAVKRRYKAGPGGKGWPEPTAWAGPARAWLREMIEPYLRAEGWLPLSERKGKTHIPIHRATMVAKSPFSDKPVEIGEAAYVIVDGVVYMEKELPFVIVDGRVFLRPGDKIQKEILEQHAKRDAEAAAKAALDRASAAAAASSVFAKLTSE